VDPSTGLATIGGTITCNERSVVYREGTLRELRQGLFVARGFFSMSETCTPDAPAHWTAVVDTDTGIAFGSGTALVRNSYVAASDGFHDYRDMFPDDATVRLV
jgi:hypothetical protein